MTCSLHTGFITPQIYQLKLAKSTAQYRWTHGFPLAVACQNFFCLFAHLTINKHDLQIQHNTPNPASETETCQKYCAVWVDSWVVFRDDAQWADAWRSDPLPEHAWHLRSTIYDYFHHNLLVYDKLAHTILRVMSKPIKRGVVAFFDGSLFPSHNLPRCARHALPPPISPHLHWLVVSFLALCLSLSSTLKVGSGEEVFPRTHLDEWYYLTKNFASPICTQTIRLDSISCVFWRVVGHGRCRCLWDEHQSRSPAQLPWRMKGVGWAIR
jgi:hypothetical protein